MKRFPVWFANCFGVGHLPIAPGTWASAIPVAVFFLLPPLHVGWFLGTAALVFLLGIPAATAAEKHYQREDPGYCVIDEVAGQTLALATLPHAWGYYLASFLLFRVFDVLKPPPVHQAERLPRGLGIMTDDIVAGLYALLVVRLYMLLFA